MFHQILFICLGTSGFDLFNDAKSWKNPAGKIQSEQIHPKLLPLKDITPLKKKTVLA